MKALKNKKGDVNWTIILTLIVLLVIVAIILWGVPPFIKNFFDKLKGKVDLYEACTGKSEGDLCSSKEIGEGVCINGVCTMKDRPALSLDHAKLLFKTTFKQNLLGCKDDVSKCDNATRNLENILEYTDNKARGKVYVIVKQLEAGKKYEFQLWKPAGGFLGSIFSGGPQRVEAFTYGGDVCVRVSDGKNDNLGSFDKNNEIGIGKWPATIDVFYPDRLKAGYEGEGSFISLKHQENKADKPLCVYYLKK